MDNQSIATKGLLRQIASVFRGEGKDIAVIFIYAAVVGLCTLAVPIAVQSLVSSVALASILQPVVVLTIFVAGVLSFSGLIRIF